MRVRPPLKPTDPGFELIPQRFQRSTLQVISPTSLAVESPQGRKIFVFDRVFGEDVYQEGVWDYLSESVTAFVQGYNVSVLAYGQSGSGKSYTMGTSGPAEQSDTQLMGMCPHREEMETSITDGHLRARQTLLMHHFLGVIPRAAGVLFEKLSASPILKRLGSSSLRTPSRYSTSFAQSPQSLIKAIDDKHWQMKATYVEVCCMTVGSAYRS